MKLISVGFGSQRKFRLNRPAVLSSKRFTVITLVHTKYDKTGVVIFFNFVVASVQARIAANTWLTGYTLRLSRFVILHRRRLHPSSCCGCIHALIVWYSVELEKTVERAAILHLVICMMSDLLPNG